MVLVNWVPVEASDGTKAIQPTDIATWEGATGVLKRIEFPDQSAPAWKGGARGWDSMPGLLLVACAGLRECWCSCLGRRRADALWTGGAGGCGSGWECVRERAGASRARACACACVLLLRKQPWRLPSP